MPATMKKVSGGYQVRTPNAIHAKKTTLANARKQVLILNMVDHGVKLKKKKKGKTW